MSVFRIMAALLLAVAVASVAPAHDVEPEGEPEELPADGHVACDEGRAGEYPCFNTDLVHFFPLAAFGGTPTSDLWGWTDPLTGSEYVLIGVRFGTAMFRLDDHGHPTLVGYLLTRTVPSTWRDIKVYANHAFVVSEAAGHGMQVFDLTRLRDRESPGFFAADFEYLRFGRAHNIAIDEDTGTAYAVGSDTCSGGLHMIDIRVPLAPTHVGCFSQDGYTHDAQCVLYHGPDVRYQGREICFAANENTLTLVDVTVKYAPVMLARAPYVGAAYTHQGWLTEDHAYFLLDDELDERRRGTSTRTFVWDVSNLEGPFVAGVHESGSDAIDHNQYVKGNHVYQANYRSGIRILRLGDLARGELAEVAYFDTIPEDDLASFSGTWSVYPYFASGFIAASDINRGLYILKADLSAVPECSDGIDDDRDGLRDYPEDPTCATPEHGSESVRLDVAFEFLAPNAAGDIAHAKNPQLRVGVLGSPSVDVGEIDRASLRLGPGEAPPLPVEAKAAGSRANEVARDGHRDLIVRFAREATAVTPADTEICLTGQISGDPFRTCRPE